MPFAEFLAAHHPDLTALQDLERRPVEKFFTWNRSRPWRGRKARPQPVSAPVAQAAVLSLLEDAGWGRAEAPTGRLVFAADVPKLDRSLRRARSADVDVRLMTAVADLPDFVRPDRPAGAVWDRRLRVGELLDVELDAVVDYGPAGAWLRVPFGKFATERSAPLDEATLAALDPVGSPSGATIAPSRTHERGVLPTSCSPNAAAGWARPGCATDSSPPRKQRACVDPRGQPLTVRSHQLHHTYATALANAALLGHVTPR